MACMCLVFASCKDDDSKKISSNHRKVVSILSDDGQKVDFRYDKEGRISEICYILEASDLYKCNYTFSQNKLLREDYDISSEGLYFKIENSNGPVLPGGIVGPVDPVGLVGSYITVSVGRYITANSTEKKKTYESTFIIRDNEYICDDFVIDLPNGDGVYKLNYYGGEGTFTLHNGNVIKINFSDKQYDKCECDYRTDVVNPFTDINIIAALDGLSNIFGDGNFLLPLCKNMPSIVIEDNGRDFFNSFKYKCTDDGYPLIMERTFTAKEGGPGGQDYVSTDRFYFTYDDGTKAEPTFFKINVNDYIYSRGPEVLTQEALSRLSSLYQDEIVLSSGAKPQPINEKDLPTWAQELLNAPWVRCYPEGYELTLRGCGPWTENGKVVCTIDDYTFVVDSDRNLYHSCPGKELVY